MSDGSFQYFKCCVVHSWNLCLAAWIFSASHMSAIPSVIPDPNMNKHLAWLHKCQHRLIEATRLLNPDICTHLYLCVCVCEGGFLHDCTDPGWFVCLIPWMCMYMGVMFMHIRIHMCIWLFVCVWTHAHLPVLVCVCVWVLPEGMFLPFASISSPPCCCCCCCSSSSSVKSSP